MSESATAVLKREQAENRRRCEHWQAQGVLVMDPDRTLIGADVHLETGVRLWPDVVLRGRTTIGARSEVRPGCWLEDTTVAENVLIKPHCVCEQAEIGSGCQVGPMAHLRPGSVMEPKSKVGNFVEMKKTVLGEGAKANHLTYLGNTTVGKNANIGAGTITCNYDGHGKHDTEIGEDAFIGSNSSLVAPVRIGRGAIVGAGSTIGRNIPDEALAVERAEQRVLDGYAPKLHRRNRQRADKKRETDS